MKGPVEGSLDAASLHVGVVAALWNQAITDKLVEGALGRLEELSAGEVTVLRVPGALELALGAKKLAEAGCDAIVAIGAVVKGDTDHYEVVVRESSRGIGLVAIETGVPVANAILAVHEFAQALERAGVGDANKGYEAVNAAVTTANALKRLGNL